MLEFISDKGGNVHQVPKKKNTLRMLMNIIGKNNAEYRLYYFLRSTHVYEWMARFHRSQIRMLRILDCGSCQWTCPFLSQRYIARKLADTTELKCNDYSLSVVSVLEGKGSVILIIHSKIQNSLLCSELCPTPQFVCWSPNFQCLRMWLHLEIVFKGLIKLK